MEDFIAKISKFSCVEDMLLSLDATETSYLISRFCGSVNSSLYDKYLKPKFKINNKEMLRLARHREFEATILP